MKVGAAIKKIEKALGVKVHHDGDGRYSCQYESRILSFIADGDRFSRDDAEAICLKVRREDDHDCYQMDYHAGYFVENISQLIETVKPAPPKFKVGDLIRFKDNKRSKRYKVAGKFGIVVETLGGRMCTVRVNGLPDSQPQPAGMRSGGGFTFYERDMELAQNNL